MTFSTNRVPSLVTDLLGSPDSIFFVDAAGEVKELALGTAGDVLTSNGPGVDPSFETGVGGSGEDNTASNVGAGGVGVFKQKTGVDLEFRNINAGSGNITVTLDGANNEIDIDVPAGTFATITGGLVTNAELATGTPNGSKFLRDDQVWAVPAGGSGSDFQTVILESAGGTPHTHVIHLSQTDADGVIAGTPFTDASGPASAGAAHTHDVTWTLTANNEVWVSAVTTDSGHTHDTQPANLPDSQVFVIAGIMNHVGNPDPHTGYQKESEKGAANGYASLGAGTLVPAAQLATGSPDGTKYLRDDQTWQVPSAAATTLGDNHIINGGFSVWQRGSGSTSRADTVYGPDRWKVLTQSNPINVSRGSGDGTTGRWSGLLSQSDASAQRIGMCQVIEGINCYHLRGREVTIQARVYITNSQAIRMAILEWGSTEDAVTTDPVSDWTSGTYTASNFFVANLSPATAPATVTPSASTWTTVSQTVTLGSSFNNLVLMIWTEGTAANGVDFYVTKVGLHDGATVRPLIARPYQEELKMCQWYFEAWGGDNGYQPVGIGQVYNSTSCRVILVYGWKRIIPTLTVSSASHWALTTAGYTPTAATAVIFTDVSRDRCSVDVSISSGLVAGNATDFLGANTTSARMYADAEM